MRNLSTWLAAAIFTLGGVAYADGPEKKDPPPTADSPPTVAPPPMTDSARDRPMDDSMRDKAAGSETAMPGDKAVGISYPSKNDAINKHLSFVDLYLSDAANATKTLSVLGDMAPSKGDAKLVAEARKLLDGAIGQALTHLKQIRTHKADLEMIVPGIDTEEPATGSATARPASAKLAKLDEL
jgi:hypothetical protein